MRRDAPLAVLLLPEALETFVLREPARALLRAPGVVALEPGRVGYGIPARLAAGQARRLVRRLPGRPAVVVVFAAGQWPLARELAARTRAEVWYGGGDDAGGEQAAFAFAWSPGEDAEAVTAPLRDRLRGLGVDA